VASRYPFFLPCTLLLTLQLSEVHVLKGTPLCIRCGIGIILEQSKRTIHKFRVSANKVVPLVHSRMVPTGAKDDKVREITGACKYAPHVLSASISYCVIVLANPVYVVGPRICELHNVR
jgi:hypothetical protein